MESLENLLSTPTQGLIDDFENLEGIIMVLGVGGKVGPILVMMAKKAAPRKRVVGIARFSDSDVKSRLEESGVECITCDLLEQEEVNKRPDFLSVSVRYIVMHGILSIRIIMAIVFSAFLIEPGKKETVLVLT